MKLRTVGGWKKTLPYIKHGNTWRKGEHLFSKVNGIWRDVSEPGVPRILDIQFYPARADEYGERYVYVPWYNPPGQVSNNTLNIYNPNIVIHSMEYGINNYAPGGPWKWLTFTVSGDQSQLPWSQLGMLDGIVLHYTGYEWQPDGGITRIWYRTYKDLPRDPQRWMRLSI